jgi:hypothetical protein
MREREREREREGLLADAPTIFFSSALNMPSFLQEFFLLKL